MKNLIRIAVLSFFALCAAQPAHAQSTGKVRGVIEQYLIEKGILAADGTPTAGSVTINTTSPLAGGTTGTTFTLSIDTATSLQALSFKVGGTDAGIARQGAAGILGLLNPGSLTSSAALRVYNTTDAATGAPTNSEYLSISWATNLCTIGTAKTGSGTVRRLTLESASGGVYVQSPNGADYLVVQDTSSNVFFTVGNGSASFRNGLEVGIGAGGSGQPWLATASGTTEQIDSLAWRPTATGTKDLYLNRQGAAGILGLFQNASGGSAALRIYNTTDATTGAPTNSEYLTIDWSSNLCRIQTGATGSGTGRDLRIRSSGSDGGRIDIAANHNISFTTDGLFSFSGAPIYMMSGTKIAYYDNIATVGKGVPAIYAYARSTAQTGANSSVATYTMATDGSMWISANVNCTAFTAGTITVKCDYTDEGNTARTQVMTLVNEAGTVVTGVTATGTYAGQAIHIRAKSGTAVKIYTTAAGWTGTYDVEGAEAELQ